MPKIKSHSSSKKRFKKTATGKFKKAKAFRRHHSWAKTTKQVRQARRGTFVSDAEHHKLTELLPYA
jgi:large subunit ribosomal protein L35